MKINRPFRSPLLVIFMAAFFIFISSSQASAAAPDGNFEKYRQAIKKEFGIDIKNFKDSMKGGRADGKPITKYPLNELLMGIKVEQEHTTDKMRALEIATDHLEEFADYYTRLMKMEEEAEEAAEHKVKHKK